MLDETFDVSLVLPMNFIYKYMKATHLCIFIIFREVILKIFLQAFLVCYSIYRVIQNQILYVSVAAWKGNFLAFTSGAHT